METAHVILEYLRVAIWPLTLFILVGIFYRQLCDLFQRLQKADLPGGFSLEVKAARALSDQVRQQKLPAAAKGKPSLPLNQANTIMLNKNLSPSPSGFDFSYYHDLAEQDPNLAVAGVRMELETMLKNYAKGNHIDYLTRDSAGIIAHKLREKEILSGDQYRLLANILNLCNMAVHGKKVTQENASDLIDISLVLVDEYLEWLETSTGKNKKIKSR